MTLSDLDYELQKNKGCFDEDIEVDDFPEGEKASWDWDDLDINYGSEVKPSD